MRRYPHQSPTRLRELILLGFALFALCAANATAQDYTYNPAHLDSSKVMQAFYTYHHDLVLIAAHRGIHALPNVQQANYVPENSIQALEIAAKEGWEAIELDVRNTSDSPSVAILTHDKTWGREWCGLALTVLGPFPYNP